MHNRIWETKTTRTILPQFPNMTLMTFNPGSSFRKQRIHISGWGRKQCPDFNEKPPG